MDIYREERQIVLALVVFSAFILGIISTVILPRQIVSTVIALDQYRLNRESSTNTVYAQWQLKQKSNEMKKTKAVLGVNSDKEESSNKTVPVDLEPWVEECDCFKK